jgi:TRAP transporter TAXI family solute receptor
MATLSRRDFGKLAGASTAAALLPQTASAQAPKLPNPLAWTAYDVGSGGYNQSVAIGKALKDAYGVDLRVLPGKNDISRQIPLREKQVDFSATGIGATYFAQEGVFEFGTKQWGPQAVRTLVACNADSTLSILVAKDSGVKTLADLKGKRVAWTVGSPSLNENIGAMLHFAGLSWSDVKRVEFPGWGQGMDGVINNQVDAAFAQTTSGKAYQLESSPRGIFWPPLPHSDREGWKRLRQKAPFFIPSMGIEGASVSKDKPHEGAAYPYPILTTYADADEGKVYAMTKAMIELFPKYKDTVPGINGWSLDRQKLDWALPLHPGAIRYFKEIGKWNDALQKHTDGIIERQKVLKAAWTEVMGKNIADDKAFEKAWLDTRATKLEAAKMDVVYR